MYHSDISFFFTSLFTFFSCISPSVAPFNVQYVDKITCEVSVFPCFYNVIVPGHVGAVHQLSFASIDDGRAEETSAERPWTRRQSQHSTRCRLRSMESHIFQRNLGEIFSDILWWSLISIDWRIYIFKLLTSGCVFFSRKPTSSERTTKKTNQPPPRLRTSR